MTTATHHLRLFGAPQLLDPRGQPVTLRTRKHLALLVYLALEAREKPLFRSALADLFWPDVREELGRHSLSQALTQFRTHLGKDSFSRSRIKVQLLNGLTTDVDPGCSKDLQPGDLALPLSGVDSGVGVSFAHWLDRARERCVRQVRTELMGRLTAARNLGHSEDAYGIAALLYAVDPLNDEAVLTLAEQHLLASDQVQVIELLRSHFARSKEELGRRPPRCMLLLSQRLERGLEPQPLPSVVHEAGQRPAFTRPDVFVDREEELDQLEAAWTAACRGNLMTCLISGPPGIGKSALVRRFVTSLTARTWPAFLVTCQEIGRRIPFAAVSDLTIRLTRDPALSGTDPIWLAEASRVTPGLRAIYPGVPEPPPAPPEAVRIRVAEALLRMLDCIADGGPLLLVFDSVQHLDPASQDVLHVLARRLETSPVLLVGTMQSDELDHAMTGAAAASGIEWQQQVDLRHLNPAQTQALVTQLLEESEHVPAEVVNDIAELSQGNPYLTEMLVSDWRNNGVGSLVALERQQDAAAVSWRPPGTMRLAFAKQYQGLSNDAQHMLHLLAVASRVIATGELETLLAFEPAALDHAALELIDRSLIRTDSGGLGFRNELHRAFVYYHEMSEEARKYHHARLAKCLTTTRSEDDFQRALEASHHYLKASMVDEAIEAVCLGAELAVTRGAPKEAERALKAVLNGSGETAPYRLTILLALAFSAQQLYQQSISTLNSLPSDSISQHHAAIVCHIRAEALHRARLAHPTTILEAAEEAITTAQRIGDHRLLLNARQVFAELAYEDGDWDKVSETERVCNEIGQATGDSEVRALASLTIGYCRLVSGDSAGASEKLSYSCRQFERQKNQVKLHWALNGLGMCHTNLGQFPRAIAVLKRAISTAGRAGDSVAQANACANLGALYNELGMFAESVRSFRRAMQLDTNESNARVTAGIACNAANLALVLGNYHETTHLLRRARKAAGGSGLWQHNVSAMLTEADLQLARGHPESAWHFVEEAISLTGGRHHLIPDAGQYWRLRQHYAWAVKGRAAPDDTPIGGKSPTLARLTHRLESQAMEEWIAILEHRPSAVVRTAATQMLELRLFGILARLAAIHIRPAPIPELHDSESGAALVAHVFSEHLRAEVPVSVLD